MARNKDMKKIDFQIDPEAYEVLKEIARKEDRSVASLMRVLIAQKLEEEKSSDDESDETKPHDAANGL